MKTDDKISTPARPRVDLASLILAPASGVAIGFVPFLSVVLLRQGFNTPSILFWRAFLALLVVIAVALWLRTPLLASWRGIGRRMFLVVLTLGTIQTYCYFRAIESLPSSIVILFFFIYPLVTVALRRWLYDERAPTITVFACVLIILGAGLTGSGTLSISGSGWIDLAFAITPPITYGLYAVIMARWSGTLPATASASIIQFGYSTGFIIMCLFAGLNVPTNATAWGAIFAAGILGSAFHVLALAYSLPRLGATGYGILTSVELVTVVLLGVWLLDEVLTLWQWLGVACVLIGIVIFRPGEKRATAG